MVLLQWFKNMTLHCFSSNCEDKYDEDTKEYYNYFDFPDDIWIEILSRLPADRLVVFKRVCRHWRVLISSYDFLKLHIKRAKPAMFVEYRRHGLVIESSSFWLGDGRSENNLSNVRENLKQFDGVDTATLIGVCDGLLMFGMKPDRRSLIVNPITKESRIIPPANDNGNARCIFFDRFEDDYKLLHLSPGRIDTIPHDLIYSFNRGVWTRLESVETQHYFQPRFEDPPVVVCDALHWTGYCYFGCSMMVQVFNIESKDFFLLPFPTAVITNIYTETKCCVSFGSDSRPRPRNHNELIRLTERDGKLCLCHSIRQRTVIEIWFLQNYGDWESWARMCMIDILHVQLNTRPCSCHYCIEAVKIVSFNDDDMLLSWPCGGLYWYSLETKKMKVVEYLPFNPNKCVPFTTTLLSPNNVYTNL